MPGSSKTKSVSIMASADDEEEPMDDQTDYDVHLTQNGWCVYAFFRY